MKKILSEKNLSLYIFNPQGQEYFRSIKFLFFLLIIFITIPGTSQNKESEIALGVFTLSAGDHDIIDAPVRFECRLEDCLGKNSNLMLSNNYHLMAIEKGGKNLKLPVQWEPKTGFSWERFPGKGFLVWILEGKTPRGSTRMFSLVLRKGTPPTAAFSVENLEKRKLLIKNGSRPVLQYNYDIIHEVEGQTGQFDRSSYIHPVWTPKGDIITGDFSPEHIWQRGIFLAWERVKAGNIITNFWELGKNTGRTLKDNPDLVVINGPVFTEIIVFNKGTIEDKTYFKEISVVRLYNRSKNETWLFDMDICQVPVDPENPDRLPSEEKILEIMKIQYGGMAFRGVSPGWLHYDFIARDKEQLSKFKTGTKWLNPADSLDILTSEGLGRINGNGTPARWLDYTGPLGKGWGGLVMFDNPANQRYPTPLRIHPDMPYFCFAFSKDNAYSISSKAPIKLTYRFVVHTGHPVKELNEQVAADFVSPPKIKWEPVK